MRGLVILVGVIVLLGGCAPDDQVFDISALSERHQRLFVEAAEDLNERYPGQASFRFSDGALSVAKYGDGIPGKNATTFAPLHRKKYNRGWLIVFRKHRIDGREHYLFAHELCHVLGFDHDGGNPDGEHC